MGKSGTTLGRFGVAGRYVAQEWHLLWQCKSCTGVACIYPGAMDGSLSPDLHQTRRVLSEGHCDLPILYRDASWLGVFFAVELPRAVELLEGTGLEPWPFFGRALAAVYAWDYRDSTVGAYKEVGLGVQARVAGASPSLVGLAMDMLAQPEQAIWVASLPVTTEAACRAGVEVWGYPKYVTEIETHFDERGGRARLGDELEVAVPRPTVFRKNLPIATYTRREGELVRTSIEVRSDVQLCAGGSLKMLSGQGQTAERARQLGLDGARVLGGFHSQRFDATLPEGKPMPLPSRAGGAKLASK